MRFNEAKLDYLPTQKFDKWPGDKVAKKVNTVDSAFNIHGYRGQPIIDLHIVAT